ncbi:MAG: aconitase family protein, partial [Sutterella wadsworthensis]
GIFHQVFMDIYNFPGCMMLLTDSHTPSACGRGMLAIGVGGADLVDALMGMEWELKMPKIIGVKLTGQLQGWASAKDVILKLTGMLSTKGATTSVFAYDDSMARYLAATGRQAVADLASKVDLAADKEVRPSTTTASSRSTSPNSNRTSTVRSRPTPPCRSRRSPKRSRPRAIRSSFRSP